MIDVLSSDIFKYFNILKLAVTWRHTPDVLAERPCLAEALGFVSPAPFLTAHCHPTSLEHGEVWIHRNDSWIFIIHFKYKVVAEYPSLVNLEVHSSTLSRKEFSPTKICRCKMMKAYWKNVGLDGGVQWFQVNIQGWSPMLNWQQPQLLPYGRRMFHKVDVTSCHL